MLHHFGSSVEENQNVINFSLFMFQSNGLNKSSIIVYFCKNMSCQIELKCTLTGSNVTYIFEYQLIPFFTLRKT